MNDRASSQDHGDRRKFLERYGGIYEKSPWVADRAWERIAAGGDSLNLMDVMRNVVDEAGKETQLFLLQAHPDLGERLSVRKEMSADSAAEQSGAGLDQCTGEEFEAFRDLNTTYRKTFGFPFILAVRGHPRTQILRIFRQRIQNNHETEFQTALDQVHRIARFRLETLDGSN